MLRKMGAAPSARTDEPENGGDGGDVHRDAQRKRRARDNLMSTHRSGTNSHDIVVRIGRSSTMHR